MYCVVGDCQYTSKDERLGEMATLREKIIKIYQKHSKGHLPKDSLVIDLIGFIFAQKIGEEKKEPEKEFNNITPKKERVRC